MGHFLRSIYDSPLGRLNILVSDTALHALWFDGQKYSSSLAEYPVNFSNHFMIQRTKDWLEQYFAGLNPVWDQEMIPLRAYNETSFRKLIRQEMLAVPYGTTVTYGAIAKKLSAQNGLKTCARAVGGAVGHNAFIIIVPCHRILASTHAGGYAAGLERKKYLLDLEKSKVSVKPYSPTTNAFGY